MHALTTRRGLTVPLALLLWIAALACASSSMDSKHSNAPGLATRLASGTRMEADQARDAGRQPAAVITFFGIESGMTVMDLIAAGGYYTDVLAEAVGPHGHVYAQNTAMTLQFRDRANDKAMTARLAGDRLPNVERLDRELEDLQISPNSLDAVVTALNFHDIYDATFPNADGLSGPEAAHAILITIKGLLRPGGVLGLIDHSGNPGLDNKKLHRIEEIKVIEAVEAAGFVVEATSDVLRHPEDDRSKFVFAKGIRGATDRFVLRLRKP